MESLPESNCQSCHVTHYYGTWQENISILFYEVKPLFSKTGTKEESREQLSWISFDKPDNFWLEIEM